MSQQPPLSRTDKRDAEQRAIEYFRVHCRLKTRNAGKSSEELCKRLEEVLLAGVGLTGRAAWILYFLRGTSGVHQKKRMRWHENIAHWKAGHYERDLLKGIGSAFDPLPSAEPAQLAYVTEKQIADWLAIHGDSLKTLSCMVNALDSHKKKMDRDNEQGRPPSLDR